MRSFTERFYMSGSLGEELKCCVNPMLLKNSAYEKCLDDILTNMTQCLLMTRKPQEVVVHFTVSDDLKTVTMQCEPKSDVELENYGVNNSQMIYKGIISADSNEIMTVTEKKAVSFSSEDYEKFIKPIGGNYSLTEESSGPVVYYYRCNTAFINSNGMKFAELPTEISCEKGPKSDLKLRQMINQDPKGKPVSGVLQYMGYPDIIPSSFQRYN